MIVVDESGQQGVNIAGVMFPVEHVTGCISLGSKGHSGYAVVGGIVPCYSNRYIDGKECLVSDPEYHIMAEFAADFSRGFIVNSENMFRKWEVSTVLGVEKNEDMARRFRQVTGRKIKWYRQNIAGTIKKPTALLEYDDEMFFKEMLSRRKKYSDRAVYVLWSTCPHARILNLKEQRNCLYRLLLYFDQKVNGKRPVSLEVNPNETEQSIYRLRGDR